MYPNNLYSEKEINITKVENGFIVMVLEPRKAALDMGLPSDKCGVGIGVPSILPKQYVCKTYAEVLSTVGMLLPEKCDPKEMKIIALKVANGFEAISKERKAKEAIVKDHVDEIVIVDESLRKIEE